LWDPKLGFCVGHVIMGVWLDVSATELREMMLVLKFMGCMLTL